MIAGADGVAVDPDDDERTLAPEDEASARMVEMALVKAGEGEHEVRFELRYELVIKGRATLPSLPLAVGSFKMRVPPDAVATGLPRRPETLSARLAAEPEFAAEVKTVEDELTKALKLMCAGGEFANELLVLAQAKGRPDGQVW